ncbi:Uncharacterized protein BP5553_10395 [Venustampulla echinocandica]|uniref:Protein kinase domain-containing protein n=1 Tax=Venustampulla echinocandica TaxID=2656787 RepID=A0A370T965_9HELO|nr:Uncharacterized protein BP5553_10395 [Venustampulla echinocandica]RDL30117.1 Uncharacterized protein BP5553_10395 [Venustampulla echinocandica]
MYTDTKSSYDFVKEPVQSAEDPELMSLHRKLRIQKDRLVSWGLEWSDPSQSPDIDESINKAGLSELVGSVMSTIKEILAEAEPLWQSSKRTPDEKAPLPEKSITWDKSRFQDLVRDLTMSIDTLYDLSRTRQSARKASPTKASESSASLQTKSHAVEERQFESTRMQTPQQIDPTTLIWPRNIKGIQSSMLPPANYSRQIVFMRRPTSLPDSRKYGQQTPIVPVLLEHAPYDPIYSITGITPSMTRFEKLFAALSQSYISSGRILSGLLHLIGYFEEPDHSRFCLLFALPTHFGPVDIESPRMPSTSSLSDMLFSPYEPSLEVKYRLAYNVASAVFDLHSKGVVHGNITSSNILFIEHQSQSINRKDFSQVNMRQSFLASYDLFSDNATDSSEGASESTTSLYRHPLDPRITRYTHLTSESKSLDLYSLAMLLLEIGLWSSLSDVFPMSSAVPENPTNVFKQLASRCGSLYLKAVQACWQAPTDELSQRTRADVMHQKVFWKVSKALDTCCAIDESSDEDNDGGDDSPPMPSTPSKASRPATPARRVLRESKSQAVAAGPTTPTRPSWSEKPSYPSLPEKTGWSEKPVAKTTAPPLQKPTKTKLRTYPAIRISPEHLDFWHTGLMPHINHVLRGFYRKYPESVEISLESIGESSSTTKPTILVICTSVNKVRSILKKHLVYDKDTFGLKVCRGKVIRSRKPGVKRSMAKELGEDVKPENAEHQDKPSNGASIGAYVGERHLPPVSFGGLIMVDDKPYGMTVHHMLDAPEEEEDEELDAEVPVLRSSAHSIEMPELTHSDSSIYSSSDEEFMYSLSDYDSDFSDEQSESEFDDDDYQDESDEEAEPGDIKGIPPGCGEEYLITQPAIDDVDEDFYPSEETRDEDHLDSFGLGEVYASSGIRRRTEDGIVHEIDWALFEFNSDRCPDSNRILSGERFCRRKEGEYPVAVAPTKDLADLEVHCMARTSGLQSGRILPAMVIVKIYGRQTPSSSYQAAGKLGVPGDSGAWLVENEQGRACGHVLAWSSKKKVAYICPMDTLLRDIKETLGARSICLPGGEDVFTPTETSETLPAPQQNDESATEPEILLPDEDEISMLLGGFKLPPSLGQVGDGREYILDTEQSNNAEQESDMRNFIPIRLATKQPEVKLAEIVMGGMRQHDD